MNEANETQIEYLRHRNIEDALTVIKHRNAQCEYQQDRIEALEEMLRKKLDLIKCGIAHNYSGDPYENDLYLEVKRLLEGNSDE